MNKKELQHITNLREDLYQAMLIGSIKLNNKSVADLYNFMNYQDKEIERLNNIINELKEYSKKRIDELKLQEGNWGLKMVSELNEVYTFYGKIINLQELKGSDKDENN